jgi:hypothetical protein
MDQWVNFIDQWIKNLLINKILLNLMDFFLSIYQKLISFILFHPYAFEESRKVFHYDNKHSLTAFCAMGSNCRNPTLGEVGG